MRQAKSKAQLRSELTPPQIESKTGLFQCPAGHSCVAFCLRHANERAPKGKKYVRGCTGMLKLVNRISATSRNGVP